MRVRDPESTKKETKADEAPNAIQRPRPMGAQAANAGRAKQKTRKRPSRVPEVQTEPRRSFFEISVRRVRTGWRVPQDQRDQSRKPVLKVLSAQGHESLGSRDAGAGHSRFSQDSKVV